jgi:hypothetical protein
MKNRKHVYGIMGFLVILFHVLISEAQISNVGPRIPTKNGQSEELPPTSEPTPSIAADYATHWYAIHTFYPTIRLGPGHRTVLWGRSVTTGGADYGFLAQRAMQTDGTISLEFWILLGKKGSANSDGTIPTEDLAGSHKFGANEERQFMDLLPGAANWKQKADSLLMRVHFWGTSVSQYTSNTPDYWVREAMSYASRRDYAHALQCLQQARALASGPQKSSLDRVIARIEQNMGR